MTNNPCRVLVALSDERIRSAIEGLFKTFRADVYYATNGATLFACLGAPRGMDLIILDGSLEGVSIETACAAERKVDRRVHSYIIALAEKTNPAEILQAFNAGADEVLFKPLDLARFLNACRIGQRLVSLERLVEEEALLAAKHRETNRETGDPGKEPGEEKEEDKAAEEEAQESSKEKAGDEKEKASPATGMEESSRAKAAILSGDGRPELVRQIEESVKQTFATLGAPEEAFESRATAEADAVLRGDFIGWQGVFVPEGNSWYDILFHFNRPGAEHLCSLVFRRDAESDTELLRAVTEFLFNLHAVHHQAHGGQPGPSAPVFCQPLSTPRMAWIAETGRPDFSQVFHYPQITLVYDFFRSPANLRVKPAAGVEPGEVMNETLFTQSQSKIPLVNRGVILTRDILRKIVQQVEPNRTLWVLEPSLLARRLNNSIPG